MFSALFEDCRQVLTAAVTEREAVSMLVSGGSTPAPLYKQLSCLNLDWHKVTVALVDERWVGADAPGSNERFIKQSLLHDNAAKANFVPMKTLDSTSVEGQPGCEHRYRQLPNPLDLTILGMGPDGHTASLFPYARGLDNALDTNKNVLCVAINAKQSHVTGELTERMSLSLFALLQSRQIHLLITGEEKLAVYKRALVTDDPLQMPIAALLQQSTVAVKVYWAP